LSNYGHHLSHVGQYDEAFPYVQQALEIFKLLAEKQPKRFTVDLFARLCFIRFLDWLRDYKRNAHDDSFEIEWSMMTSDQQTLMQLFSSFVQAVTVNENNIRSNEFRSMLSAWTHLTVKGKRSGEPFWLCAAAWCAKYDSLTENAWEVDWQIYASKRNGHIPLWMLEVARRLEFQFPEQSQHS